MGGRCKITDKGFFALDAPLVVDGTDIEFWFGPHPTKQSKDGEVRGITLYECLERKPDGFCGRFNSIDMAEFEWDEDTGRVKAFTYYWGHGSAPKGNPPPRAKVKAAVEKRLRKAFCQNGNGKKSADPHEGMVYNPYTDRWSWF